jgi:L-lactate dehydrogenase complex protein LldF
MTSRVEEFAKNLDPNTTASVRKATAKQVTGRIQALAKSFADPEDARERARQIKDAVLDNLEALLVELEANCTAHGIHVHHAKDADEANAIILALCRRFAPEGGTIAKAKSMATEEIHLNKHLIEAGYQPVETDLGEFIVQIDGDTPSHIVAPVIHKTRLQIAASFDREGVGPYTEVPEELALQAREHLREKFREAKIGISGVNFGIAASGRLVIVENEGNNRLSTTVPRVHIALMGIEKLLPEDKDLVVFLPLLAGSATGQLLTTYMHLIHGPRRDDEPDGPDEVHLVLLDNGRRKVLDGPYRDILRCIRCGACLNVCPVYRQASGHAYGHVYSGPLGAVLAPAMEGVKVMGDLAKASSLCGACEEVCPVKIPIPHMLLQLREEAFKAGVAKNSIPWKWFGRGASSSLLWRTGLKLLPMAARVGHPLKDAWTEYRELPAKAGRDFRSWWHDR